MLVREFWTHALCFIAAVTALMPASQAQEAPKAERQVVAVFRLSGTYSESPVSEDLALFGGGAVESFWSLVQRLEQAQKDEQVKGVVLLLDSPALGTAQIEEVRRCVAALKQSGKKVVVHADSYTTTGYWLATAASEISIVPTGDLWLTGLYSESLHLRGLMDLLGIVPDFLALEEYKSAAEVFTRYEPSDPARENIAWLLDSIYDRIVTDIAQARGGSPEQVRRWIDHGLYSAEGAKAAGIVDRVETREQLHERLKAEVGDGLVLQKNYGRRQSPTLDLSSPLGILKFYADLLAGTRPRATTQDTIAIVYVEGPILPGSEQPGMFPLAMGGVAYSEPIRKALLRAANDEKIKAVVMRVNSPGGSAVASEIIMRASRQVREKKPLVVSMGDVAGSGGYYVAMAAEEIVAEPTTITASIGVVGGKLATQAAWARIGVHWHSQTRGAMAGILNSGMPFTPQERQRLQSWMQEVYEVFKDHVRANRNGKLRKALEELAGGRVFTGTQAQEAGLVDRLGGLGDAIRLAAEKAGLEEGKYQVKVLPEPKSLAELLFGEVAGGQKDRTDWLMGPQPHTPLLRQVLPLLQGMDRHRVEKIVRTLAVLECLQNEQVWLWAPQLMLW